MEKEEKLMQAQLLVINFVDIILEVLSKKWDEKKLSLAQIRLLVVLKRRKNATIGEIATQLHIGQSAASSLVDGLVKKELLFRADDPEDRRKAIVKMTPGGETLIGKQKGNEKQLSEWLAGMDENKLDNTIETIQAFMERLT